MNISNKSRHIRWNSEESPDNSRGNESIVRYHFIVVDDRNREMTMEKIVRQLSDICVGVIPIRKVEGRVKDSKLGYLFRSFDSPVASRLIEWSKINKSVKQDSDLKERKRGNIEDYVSRVYE